MRSGPLVFGVLAITGTGCADTCGTPQSLVGQVWDVVINAVTFSMVNEERFPAEDSPGNGRMNLAITWGSASAGPIDVAVDGQPFNGQGTWFETECGQFTARWSGTYEGERSTHEFSLAGLFSVYDEGIGGDIDYAEAWSRGDDVGTYKMKGHLLGSLAALR